MARDDDEKPWTRQLLVVVVALAVVALVIGGILSVFALGAVRVTGIDSAGSSASAEPSLYIPSDRPTVGLQQQPGPSGRSSRSATNSPSDSPSSPKPTPRQLPRKARAITLQAFPQRVSPGQRINLTGLYRGGTGARLQVQRLEGDRWSDFPVTASVIGGAFTTYVTTSIDGPQRFRVTDRAARRASNPVRVVVG